MEEPISVTFQDQRDSALKYLYQQVEDGSKYCDLQVRTEDGSIVCVHKCLFEAIPFFSGRARFVGTASTEPVDLPNISKEILLVIVKFVYLGEFTINYCDVRELFRAADFLSMRETLMAKVLNELFKLPPTLHNIWLLHSLCEDYGLSHPGVQDLRLRFDAKLEEILETELLESVDHKTLMKYITGGQYEYVPRFKFAKFLIRWVLLDEDNREEFFPNLFDEISLKKMDTKDISELLEMYRTCFPRKFPIIGERLQEEMKAREKRKNPTESVGAILVAGGIATVTNPAPVPFTSRVPSSHVWAYLLDKGKWVALPELPARVQHPSMATDGKETVFVCDLDQAFRGNYVLTVHKYSLQNAIWTTEQYAFPRQFCPDSVKALIALQGKFYALVYGQIVGDISRIMTKAAVFELKDPLQGPFVIDDVYPRTRVNLCGLLQHFVVELYHKHQHEAYAVNPSQQSKWKIREKDLVKGFLCHYQGGYVLYNPGNSAKHVILRNAGVRVIEEVAMDSPTMWVNRRQTGYASLDGDLVVCGGMSDAAMDNLSSALVYEYDTQQWRQLPDMPEGLETPAVVTVQLPAKYTHCCTNCPHCLFPTRLGDFFCPPEYPPPHEIWD